MKNTFSIMENVQSIGIFVCRYGVVYILIAFGIFKFTNTEAQAIKPLIDNSPIFSWLNGIFSIRTISGIIGFMEIVTALAIGSRFFSETITFYGSMVGSIIFIITLSFLFTTPNMITKTEGIWLPDGFIIKDLVLLGFCLWSAGEAYSELFFNQINQN